MAAATGVHQRRADLEQNRAAGSGPTWKCPRRPSRPGASTNGPSGPRPPARKRSPNCWRRARAGTSSERCCRRWRAEIGSRQRPSACASAILCRGHLGALEGAATWYRWALQANPEAAGARAGLWALLDGSAPPAVQVTASAALAAAAAETDDWALTLRLLEPRLALAGGSAEKAERLCEAARLAESRANNRSAAFAALARAMPLAPDNRAIESEALRLAGETGDHAGLVRAVDGSHRRSAGRFSSTGRASRPARECL